MAEYPWYEHEEEFYAEIDDRYRRVEDDMDELSGEVDERDGSNLAHLVGLWVGSKLVSHGLAGESSPPEVLDRSEWDWFDRHVARSYEAGREAAGSLLDAAGYTVNTPSRLADSRRHVNSLGRVFEEQRDVWRRLAGDLEDDVEASLRETLGSGASVSDGKPLISERFDKLGRNRGSMIAATETSRAYNSALVTEYEEAGVRDVEVRQVEWQTMGDLRVCEGCAGMAGEYTVDEAKKMLRRGTFPHHPRCRCILVPGSS